MAAKFKTLIPARTWQHNQSWCHEQVLEAGKNGIRIRIFIVRNAYDEQSSAIVSVMNGLEWSRLTNLNVSLWPAKVRGISYTSKNVTDKDFADLATLLANEAEVLLAPQLSTVP